MNGKLNIEDLEDSVIYDLFYESATHLGAIYLRKERKARKNGDIELYNQLHDEEFAMLDERDSIASHDREAQIACKRKWDDRARELRG